MKFREVDCAVSLKLFLSMYSSLFLLAPPRVRAGSRARQSELFVLCRPRPCVQSRVGARAALPPSFLQQLSLLFCLSGSAQLAKKW